MCARVLLNRRRRRSNRPAVIRVRRSHSTRGNWFGFSAALFAIAAVLAVSPEVPTPVWS